MRQHHREVERYFNSIQHIVCMRVARPRSMRRYSCLCLHNQYSYLKIDAINACYATVWGRQPVGIAPLKYSWLENLEVARNSCLGDHFILSDYCAHVRPLHWDSSE